jgi:hypothetical protein
LISDQNRGPLLRRQTVERRAGRGGGCETPRARFDTGLAIGGATLPVETCFVYGAPGTDGQDELPDGWKDRALV